MSSYRLLYIFVEGNDDERFFDRILTKELKKRYTAIKIIKYAHMKKEKVDDYIKSIKGMRADGMRADYIYVTDINDSPCITAKKDKVLGRYRNIDGDRILVVVKEIESWYLAGLDDGVCKQLKIDSFSNTGNITKEQFDALALKRFRFRIERFE